MSDWLWLIAFVGIPLALMFGLAWWVRSNRSPQGRHLGGNDAAERAALTYHRGSTTMNGGIGIGGGPPPN